MVGWLSYIVQQNHPANHPKYCWINPVQQKTSSNPAKEQAGGAVKTP